MNRTNRIRSILLLSPLGALLAIALTASNARARDESSQPYGFDGFEIYKLDRKIGLMCSADLDEDGLADLLIANNNRAKIELFLRRRTPVAPKALTGEKLPNDLVDDRFYERKDLLTEKAVSSMTVGDFNGDGHVDVAFYGQPPELVVAYGDGKGGFPTDVSFPVDGGSGSPHALAAGDLNGDGRIDLARMGKSETAIYRQSDKGVLGEPTKIPHTVKGVSWIEILDLNGDGRSDLLHIAPDSRRSVRVLYQRADGSLGAEVSFRSTPWRALEFGDVDAAKGMELLVVQRTSGLVRSLRTTSRPAAETNPVALGGAQVHAFDKGRGKGRSMAVGDVNGDGRQDLVVTEPGTAQVALYLQGTDGNLTGQRLYPSLSNSETVRVADLDGDGRGEVIVLSSAEKTVGIASLKQDGLMPFPAMLNLSGTPKALDTGDLNGDGRADLAVVVEKDKKSTVLLFHQGEKGGLQQEPLVVLLEGLKNPPDDLMLMDINQDGGTDLLLFDRYGPLKIWLRGSGAYVDVGKDGANYRGGLVNKLGRGSVSAGDIDGDGKPELLVSTKNFARALRLGTDGLKVVDQANGASSSSQVKGAITLDVDGDGTNEVALFDGVKNNVTILRRNDTGVFEIAARTEVGDLDLQAMFASDVNGDGRADVLLAGKNLFAVLHTGGTERELTELSAYESPARNARLSDVAIGDLNGDGRPDVVALDAGNRSLRVLSYDPEKGFDEKISWRVHEKKMHENSRDAGGAREVLVTDLNGDGLNDIAIIIHDRLLVYLQ